jgi:hypothetical protein
MQKIFVAASCLSLIFLNACSSSKNTSAITEEKQLSSKDKKDGWQMLFDGKTTNGWHTYNRDTVSSNWKIIDGTLVTDPKAKTSRGMEDIITNEDYENYELSVEWRVADKGNSGIIFNVVEDKKYGNTYNTGLEMQVLDNINAEDNKKENHLAGLLYDISGTAAMSKPKPVGEWNEARIIQNKGHLTFYFNGEKTLDVQHGSEEWKNMIAASKFKTWENFAATTKGKIAFQDHGYEAAFRNIKIRKL